MAGMEINNNSDFVRSADGEKFHSNLSLPSLCILATNSICLPFPRRNTFALDRMNE
jgi:hypothetical protein